MRDKASRKREARDLVTRQGLSRQEAAAALGLRPSTIRFYAKEDAKRGQPWELSELADDEALRREFLECVALLLAEARRCLKDLRKDRLLGPEVRAKQIGNLMGILDKATQTAKKFDPSLNLEAVLAVCLKVVGEVLIERAPGLGETFLAHIEEIEHRLVEVRGQWRL